MQAKHHRNQLDNASDDHSFNDDLINANEDDIDELIDEDDSGAQVESFRQTVLQNISTNKLSVNQNGKSTLSYASNTSNQHNINYIQSIYLDAKNSKPQISTTSKYLISSTQRTTSPTTPTTQKQTNSTTTKGGLRKKINGSQSTTAFIGIKKFQQISPKKENKNLGEELQSTKNSVQYASKMDTMEKKGPVIKDFKQAYKQLTSKIINEQSDAGLSQILLTDKSIHDYKKQTNTQQASSQNIFDKLYQEKEKYLVIKDNSHREKELLEQELGKCTFSPQVLPNKHKKRRNFDKVYQDLIDFQQQSLQKRIDQKEAKLKEEDLSNRPSKSVSRRVSERNLSPQQTRVILYEHGKNKLKEAKYKATTKDIGQFDKNFTFKPKICNKSQKIIQARAPQRELAQISELLYQEGVQKLAEKQEKINRVKQPTHIQSLKKSEKMVEQKLNKVYQDALNNFGWSEQDCLDKQQLFDFMKQQNYVTEKDQPFVDKVHTLMSSISGSQCHASYLIIILCGIENLWLEYFVKDIVLSPEAFYKDTQTSATSVKKWCLGDKQDFLKFHQVMQRFGLNKAQNTYKNKVNEAIQQNLSPRSQFSPTLNKRSLQIEQRRARSRKSTSTDRSEILLEQGKAYMQKKKDIIANNSNKDIEPCTFKPEINNSFKTKKSRADDVHNQLYSMRKKQAQIRDISTEENDYEKSKGQCTFKPTINHSSSLSYLKSPKNEHIQSKLPTNYFSSKQIIYEKPNSKQVNAKSRTNTLANENKAHFTTNLSKSQKQEPLLIMDVNITSGNKAKLIVFEDDDPVDVVNQFSQTHDLNEAKKKKLLEVLQDQMQQLLRKASETEEELGCFEGLDSISRTGSIQ